MEKFASKHNNKTVSKILITFPGPGKIKMVGKNELKLSESDDKLNKY